VLPIADRFVRVNERIRAREIRVIDEEGNQLGIMPPYEGLKLARERGLDLVEVSPTATPPVCRIINYGKYLYQLSKRQHEARKHQRSSGLKEVKFSPRTGEHAIEVKRNQMLKFLQEGNKVKATVEFRGREMAHRDLGWKLLERLINNIGDACQVETRPKQEGRNLSTILAPKKPGAKGAGQPRPAAPKHPGGTAATKPVVVPSAIPVAAKLPAPTESSDR
jgi:translation initiation factor IF-3